jgi:hypothetical protein
MRRGEGGMEDFDLDRYLRASKKADLSGLPWDRVRLSPLSVGEARTLAYMMDIESHTVVFLRDMETCVEGLEQKVATLAAAVRGHEASRVRRRHTHGDVAHDHQWPGRAVVWSAVPRPPPDWGRGLIRRRW